MKVRNNAKFPVIANGCTLLHGCGIDTIIQPGQTVEVNGPTYIDLDDNQQHVETLAGKIGCTHIPGDGRSYYVAPGKPVVIGGTFRYLTVRHHLDAPVVGVTSWRRHETLDPSDDDDI